MLFSPHYYKEYIIRDAVGADNIKRIAVDGIYPDKKQLKPKPIPLLPMYMYPYVLNVDHNSMTYNYTNGYKRKRERR